MPSRPTAPRRPLVRSVRIQAVAALAVLSAAGPLGRAIPPPSPARDRPGAVALFGYDDRRVGGPGDLNDPRGPAATAAFKHGHAGEARDVDAPAQAPTGDAPTALFATGPAAVITTTVPVTNAFDNPHVFSVETEPGVDDGAWPIAFGPARSLAAGASARIAVTVSVPIGAVDAQASVARLHVRARGNGGSRGWVAERTLYAWTGGDMRVDRYVGCRGDLDGSGVIDDDDAAGVAAAFDRRAAEPGFDPVLDFDHDGRIGAADVQAVAGRRGHACAPSVDVDTSAPRQAVTIEAIRAHLQALQAIADDSGGNRASGTTGYERSVAYMRGQLESVGYAVDVRPFTYPGRRTPPPAVFEQLLPIVRTFGAGTDFLQGSQSGAGDVTADIVAVDVVVPPGPAANGNTSGCEPADFDGFPPGAVALIQRGTCAFDDKIANAVAAGASAVVLFNEGQADRDGVFDVTMRAASGVSVLGTGYAVGEALVAQLRAGERVRVHVKTESAVVELTGQDVIAEWPSSLDDGVVMIGAHLDSVPAGPGINDDGSGAATVVELARQVARLNLRPRHRLRFALWGAEELGLWGSRRYVEALPADARDRLLAYLNFDMIGSPNPIRGIYDSRPERDGADEIEARFGRWFDTQGAAHEKVTVVTGRSDHAYFSTAGIPIGGLFTGLNQAMSVEQAARYGGTAGAQMDPCYHQKCDTLANINWPMLDEMADAVVHVTWSLANDPLFPLTSRRARPLASVEGRAGAAPSAAAEGMTPRADAPPPAHPRPDRPWLDLRPLGAVAQSSSGEVAVVAGAVRGMAAFEATLRYDPASVRILGVEGGDFTPAGSLVLGPTGAEGVVAIGAAASASAVVTGTGRIATVRYERLRGALSPRIRVDRGATGVFDAAGVRLPPPAGLRLEGATVAGVWLPVGFAGP